jgi:hypothetical protein
VRGAGHGELLVVEAELVGGTALDQRQRLQDLDRRAREDRPVDVAQRRHDGAFGIDDGDRAAVHRLAGIAAARSTRIGLSIDRHCTPTIPARCRATTFP